LLGCVGSSRKSGSLCTIRRAATVDSARPRSYSALISLVLSRAHPPLRGTACGARFRPTTHSPRPDAHNEEPVALAARSATTHGLIKTGGTQRRCPQGRRQPAGSGNLFAAFGRELSSGFGWDRRRSLRSSPTLPGQRSRGPTLASCQRPRPSLAPRRPHRRRASARKSSSQLDSCPRARTCGGFMKTWLTVAEGAEYAGVSRDTIYTACERGELHHARIGGRRSIRIKAQWIDGWLERHARGAEHLRTSESRQMETAP
jgi:excisionase family DNA binding protein